MNTLLRNVITEEDQQAFNDLAASFAGGKFADCVHEYEYPYSLDPSELVSRIAELGFLSVNLPSDHGGLGLTFQPLAGILEQLSIVDAGIAGAVFANAAALEVIAVASSTSDCEEVYEMLGPAGALPLAFQAYSDPSEARVPACITRDGSCLLYGRADLLVQGGTALYAVLPAVHNDGSCSYFLVSLDQKEIKKSGPVVTIGMQSCRPVDIELDGAIGVLIGSRGEGMALHGEVCRRMSFPSCGIFLGIMKGSFDTALDYCGQRYQGGRMIVQWNDVRMKLAGMGSLVALAETCVLGLKQMFASGSREAGPSAVSSAVHMGNMAASVSSEGIQLLGGNGYMKDYGQEKRMRDAKQAQCLLGSSPLRKKRYIDAIIKENQEESH